MDKQCPHGMGVTCSVCQVEALRQQRDEARAVAQAFAAAFCPADWPHWEQSLRDYPWLKETPGSGEPPGE
jgi:hypothetical protein